MPFIPRQVKPPARLAITCKVPQEVATLLKHYAEFLDSSQEYVVAETLCLAFRRDKEFHSWLATTHPETRVTTRDSLTERADQAPPRGIERTTRSEQPSNPADTKALGRGDRGRA